MDLATHRLIELLHRAPYQYVLAVTGGGAGAVADLLGVPGGSRTVLEAVVPYHEQALIDFLGSRPESFCSAATAQALATRALERARWLVPGAKAAGVGCTASLATDRPKRGGHRFHLCARTAERMLCRTLVLTKNARERAAEEAVLDAVLLNTLAEAFNVALRLEPVLLPGEELESETQPSADSLSALLRGAMATVCVAPDGRLNPDAPKPKALLPGAFNPVHEGHWGLAQAATRLTGLAVAFELSVTNVDKPALEVEEVRRRLCPFAWKAPVWLTRAPRFIDKALLFPGVVFVVGADTALRIIDARYYEGSPERLTEALAQIRKHGCSFLVAGRKDASGHFLRLEHLSVPAAFRALFADIPQTEFHLDLSSTEMRAQHPEV